MSINDRLNDLPLDEASAAAKAQADALQHRAELYLKDGNRAKAIELLSEAETVDVGTVEDGDAMLDEVEITTQTEIEEEPVILKMAGSPVLSVGNIAAVIAQKKAGKSAWMGAAIASSFGENGRDYLGAELLNPENFAIIRIDTEQSRFHHQKLLKTIEARAGRELPAHVRSYNFRGHKPSDVLKGIVASMKRAKRECGGIALMGLDGIAQCVTSVLDDRECAAVVSELSRYCEDFETGMLAALHLNPSSEFKSRGHLGSELERLGETGIQFARKDETIEVWTEFARGKPIERKDAFRFAWGDAEGMFMTTAGKTEIRQTAKELADLQLVLEMAGGDGFAAWRHAEFIARFMEITGQSEATAKRFLKRGQNSMTLSYNSSTGFYGLGVTARKAIQKAANADEQRATA